MRQNIPKADNKIRVHIPSQCFNCCLMCRRLFPDIAKGNLVASNGIASLAEKMQYMLFYLCLFSGIFPINNHHT